MRQGMFGLLAPETIPAHAIVVEQAVEPDRLCAL
jgi:hypothetical protein